MGSCCDNSTEPRKIDLRNWIREAPDAQFGVAANRRIEKIEQLQNDNGYRDQLFHA